MKKQVKRYLSLVLMFALVFAIPFAFTQQASAASSKTKYVVTSMKSTDDVGKTQTTKYTYFKNGLLKTSSYSDGSKAVFTRNKKGYQTKFKRYENGKLDQTLTYKYKYNKKGLATKQSVYDSDKKLIGFYTVTYYKNGKVKQEKYSQVGDKYELTFKYNKKGDCTLIKTVDKTLSSVDKYTYKYDKNGNPVKESSVTTWKDNTGSGQSTTNVTHKYTYDKHKNIKKDVASYTYDYGNGEKSTSKITRTYKYKKVKVASKYLHFFN